MIRSFAESAAAALPIGCRADFGGLVVRFWAVAILCTIPPFAIGTFYVYICIFVEVDHTYGIKYFNVLCTGVTIAIGLVVQFVYGRCCSSLRDEDDDEVRILHKSPWAAPGGSF